MYFFKYENISQCSCVIVSIQRVSSRKMKLDRQGKLKEKIKHKKDVSLSFLSK